MYWESLYFGWIYFSWTVRLSCNGSSAGVGTLEIFGHVKWYWTELIMSMIMITKPYHILCGITIPHSEALYQHPLCV